MHLPGVSSAHPAPVMSLQVHAGCQHHFPSMVYVPVPAHPRCCGLRDTGGGGTGKHPGIAAPHIFVSGIAGQGQPLSGSWLLQPPCKGCFPGRRHHSGAYLDLAPVVLPACIRGERGRLESLLPTP